MLETYFFIVGACVSQDCPFDLEKEWRFVGAARMHHINANMYKHLYLGLLGGSLQESKITNVKTIPRHELLYASTHIKHLTKPSFVRYDKITAS